eukprot:UN01679
MHLPGSVFDCKGQFPRKYVRSRASQIQPEPLLVHISSLKRLTLELSLIQTFLGRKFSGNALNITVLCKEPFLTGRPVKFFMLKSSFY